MISRYFFVSGKEDHEKENIIDITDSGDLIKSMSGYQGTCRYRSRILYHTQTYRK